MADELVNRMGQEIMKLQTQKQKALSIAKKAAVNATDTGIIALTAGALVFVENRFPDRAQVAKIPLSGVAAALLLGGSLSGLLPDDPYLLAAGQGAGAAFACHVAAKKGAEMKAAADAAGK